VASGSSFAARSDTRYNPGLSGFLEALFERAGRQILIQALEFQETNAIVA